jgi:hypothetical protein
MESVRGLIRKEQKAYQSEAGELLSICPFMSILALERQQSWEDLSGAGRVITALVELQVKRTFSEFRRLSTGLPALKPAEAEG